MTQREKIARILKEYLGYDVAISAILAILAEDGAELDAAREAEHRLRLDAISRYEAAHIRIAELETKLKGATIHIAELETENARMPGGSPAK